MTRGPLSAELTFLPARLAEAIGTHSLTYEAVAQETGLSIGTVHDFVNRPTGKRGPVLATLVAIARYLERLDAGWRPADG